MNEVAAGAGASLDRTIQNISATGDPTQVSYQAFCWAYDFFNDRLFGGNLPRPLITLQRRRATYGYFSGGCFGTVDGIKKIDELAINPVFLHGRSIEEILSTLVHEQTHVQQHHAGKPGRRGYHNKEWVGLMKRVGLIASATGKPGGKQTGDSVSHYILPDAPFDRACHDLISQGFAIPYVESPRYRDDANTDQSGNKPSPRQLKAASKTRYSCPDCGLRVWGKPDINVLCTEHKQRMSMQ